MVGFRVDGIVAAAADFEVEWIKNGVRKLVELMLVDVT